MAPAPRVPGRSTAVQPDAVVGRLARPEIDNGEARAAELELLAVRDGPVGTHALLRPLVAEHRVQDLLRERSTSSSFLRSANRRQRLSVGGDDCIYDPAGRLLAAAVNDYGRAFCGECRCDCLTDAACGASDKRAPSRELEIHDRNFLSAVELGHQLGRPALASRSPWGAKAQSERQKSFICRG
jgi:hypothetical protein